MDNFDYINFEDINGNSLLMQSVAKNDVPTVEKLIRLGSNINHANQHKENILTFALKLEDKTLIESIFPHIQNYTKQIFSDATIEALYAKLTHKDEKILSLYQFDLTLSEAITKSDYKLTEILLKKGSVFNFETFTHLNNQTKEKALIEFLTLFESFGLDKKDARFAEYSLKLCPKQIVWDYLVNNNYEINTSIFSKKLGQIQISQKAFKDLFLKNLNETNYKDVSLWELDNVRVKKINPIIEFANYVIKNNWDINFKNNGSGQCGDGQIFYMIDQLYYNSINFGTGNQDYNHINCEILTTLYKKVLEKTDLNQKPFGNPLFFEAFCNLWQFRKEIPILNKLDFSLTDYDKNNNILTYLFDARKGEYEKNNSTLFIEELNVFHELLDNFSLDINHKNKHEQSFLTNVIHLFLRATGNDLYADKVKLYKNQIASLLVKIVDTQQVDMNQKIGKEKLSIQEALNQVKGTENKVLAERVSMQLMLKQANHSTKKLKI